MLKSLWHNFISPPFVSYAGVGYIDNNLYCVHIYFPKNKKPILSSYTLLTSLQTQKISTTISSNYVLNTSDYKILLVNSPPVPSHELCSAVRWQIQEFIDFPVDDAVLDIFDIPVYKSGAKKLYAVVTENTVIQQHIKMLDKFPLTIESIDIVEMALRNIAIRLPEDKQGVALLWLQQDYAMVTLSCNKILFLSRRIEIACTDLFHLFSQQTLASSPFSLDKNTLTSTLDLICVEIQRSLDYYSSNFKQKPINALVLAPIPQDVPQLCQYLNTSLGIKTRTFQLTEILDVEMVLSPAQESAAIALIGAALRSDEQYYETTN